MKKRVVVAATVMSMSLIFGGCSKEITADEAKATKTYQTLKSKYDALKLERSTLKEELSKSKKTQGIDSTVKDYLDKIKRDKMVKVSVSTVTGSEYKIFDTDPMCSYTKNLLAYADNYSRISVDSMKATHEALYKYVVYDEDNTVYEATVYDGDYLIFTDLPDKVLYSSGAVNLGRAYYKSTSVTTTKGLDGDIFYLLNESPIALCKDKTLTETKGKNVVAILNEYKKKKLKKEPSNAKKERCLYTITFLSNGNRYDVDIYEKWFSVITNNADSKWYAFNVNSSSIYKQSLEKVLK